MSADSTAHRRGQRTTRPRLRVVNAFTCWILRTPLVRRFADHQVVELRYTATRTGRPVVLPVMYAQRDDTLVVLVGGPERKRWWRSFLRPRPVQVLLRGVIRTGVARTVAPGDPDRAEASAVYNARFPAIGVQADPIVIITLDPVG